MTESMIEKVARAIGGARCKMTGGTIELIPSDMLLARAAIEAMREPNDEMIAAAKKACGFEETQMLFKVLEDAGLANLTVMKWTGDIEYRAMIDAALDEEVSE